MVQGPLGTRTITMQRGKFIALEGSDGAGKTTQLDLLVDYLAGSRKIPVLRLREPGGTVIGEEIRDLFKAKELGAGMTAETELLLVQASRAQLVRERIQPALQQGIWVVCDRFLHSTLLYQGYGRGLDPDMITATTLFATGGLSPDLVLLLTLPQETARQRTQARAGTDRLEDEAVGFFSRVQQGVEALAARSRRNPGGLVQAIDASQSIEEVHQEVVTAVMRRLGGTLVSTAPKLEINYEELPVTSAHNITTQDRSNGRPL